MFDGLVSTLCYLKSLSSWENGENYVISNEYSENQKDKNYISVNLL